MQSHYQPPRTPHYLSWKVCAWAGFAYAIAILLSWGIIAGFLPPPAASLSVDATYQYYLDNSFRIKVGMLLTLVFNPLYYIWGTAVTRVMQRIEGPSGNLGNIQLMGAFGTVVVTWGSVATWLSAAFDTELKSPQDIKAIADLAWIWFDCTAMVSVTQFVAFGCVCLIDKNETPLIPRWVGWFSIAMGLSLTLALLIPFFHTGPFAWDGLFCYYVGLGDFFLWILVVSYYTSKAIKRLESEEDAQA